MFHFWVNGSFAEMGIDFIKKCIAWFFIAVAGFKGTKAVLGKVEGAIVNRFKSSVKPT